MTVVPKSLAEVPFGPASPLTLLNLEQGHDGQRRTTPQHDYAGYGFCVVEQLRLCGEDGRDDVLHRALVLALHSADDQPDPDSIELDLQLPTAPGEEPVWIETPLERFLAVHFPRLPTEPPDVVLALCNPTAVEVGAPEGLGTRRFHYAHGDVLSWLDVDAAGCPQVRLQARAWRTR